MQTHQEQFNLIKQDYLNASPTPIIEIAGKLGIIVREKNLHNKDKYGEISKDTNNKYTITYNSQVGALRQRHTIAHEIGHFVLHEEFFKEHDCIADVKLNFKSGGYTEIELMQEEEANNFAVELLAPKNLIFKMLVAGQSIEEIADNFAVTEATINLSIGWEVGLGW